MYEMFPQAELENYKLQVELLQEKLQRSEENRQQLEHKLDKVLQKRSELDKSMRHKTRQKYQEFLEEQRKRNERNKMLVQMLERIDQQTAAMSARSERLKMMKMQYQMYFAKLVQTQTMRCLQQSTAPAAIPVLVPTATQAPTTPTAATTNQTLAETSLNLTPRNLSAEPTNPAGQPQQQQQQQWTLAMATPTQAGMLLATPTRPSATANEYLQYPIGYMPRMNTTATTTAGALGYEDLYVGGGLGVGLGPNFYDMRPSLRAFDMQQQQQSVDLRKSMYVDAMDNFDDALPTGVYQTTNNNRSSGGGRGESSTHATPTAGTGELSSTSSTLATSSLTFDKLPKTRLSESVSKEQQQQWGEEERQERHAASSKNDDIGKPQMAALTGRRRISNGSSINGINNNNSNYYGDNIYKNNASIDDDDDDEKDKALPNSRVSKVEQEKSSNFALNNQRAAQEPWTAAEAVEQQQANIAANFATLKIDEPKTWQQTQLKPESMNDAAATFEPRDENTAARMTYTTAAATAATATAAAVAAAAAAVTATATATATPATGTATRSAALVDEQGNQLPATSLNQRANDDLIKPTMSIENIENAIYGELVNPTTTTTTTTIPNAVSGHVAQGLFENLAMTQEPQISEPQAGVSTETAEPTTSVAGNVADTNAHKLDNNNATSADAVAADYAADYEATSYAGEQTASSVNYEPTYATIDGNTAVSAAALTQEQNVEPIYSEIGNPTDDYQRGYESLSADASADQESNVVDAAAAAATAVATNDDVDANQQDYANIDYSNYDASQYGNAYDPNAYPGYIYDETTGQYIADPNAPQYATDENYAAQGYADGEAANYDYSAAYAQQQQEQDSNVAGMETPAVDLYGESEVTQAQAQTAGGEPEVTNTEAEISPTTMAPAVNEVATEDIAAAAAAAPLATGKIVKPTSILSSADKQAAANDAQQKKKKRVNFVDSSETDDSSSAKPAQGGTSSAAGGAGSESDFDFSVSSEAQN